jgi:hypothetical protein
MQQQRLSQFKLFLTLALALCLPLVTYAQPPLETKPRPEAARNKDPRQLFTPQEQSYVIPGLGNPIAQMLIFRELERRWPLFPRQRVELQTLSREAGPKLLELRRKRAQLERALEEALYGANFDAAAVEALTEESAATQQELVKFQGQTEMRLMQILARGNPRRARMARAFVELLVHPPANRTALPLLLARPNGGPMRFVTEFFGDDWEMAIPGFGNPASFLLILNQLELTPEQKVEAKTLANGIRVELQNELGEANKQQAAIVAQRNEAREFDEAETQEAGPRMNIAEQLIANNAARQARQIKRQARIETRIRQILQPRQWETYVALLRGLAASELHWSLQNALPKNLLRRPNAVRRQPDFD